MEKAKRALSLSRKVKTPELNYELDFNLSHKNRERINRIQRFHGLDLTNASTRSQNRKRIMNL